MNDPHCVSFYRVGSVINACHFDTREERDARLQNVIGMSESNPNVSSGI